MIGYLLNNDDCSQLWGGGSEVYNFFLEINY